MKPVVLFIGLFFCACSSNTRDKLPANIEVIPVDVHTTSKDALSFFERIEVLPLETNDSSVVSTGRKVMYSKEMDTYSIYTGKQVVYNFDGKGHFIASSQKVKGQGPEEYYMAVDVKFNPFRHGIDFLSPYGTVYTYSPTFEFIGKKTIQPEFFFDALMPLSEHEYIFSVPDTWVGQEVSFVDFETKEMQPAAFDGTISGDNTADKECFYQLGDDFYFVPRGINYYFYQIDKEQKKLLPVIYLDFGKDEIQADRLPGVGTGERIKNSGSARDGRKVETMLREIRERGEYIREKELVVPVVKFFNENYVYILLSEGKKLAGTYIYNRKQKKGFLSRDDHPFYIWPCFGIADNVLLAICDAYYVKGYINEELMSDEDIEKIRQLEDEDNPVILKYYLR